MNNVAGVDVSKGKSVVSVLRPFGEVVAKPFAVGHTGSELKELADYLKSLDGETRVVMEHTGRYYEPVARFLHEEGQSIFCYTIYFMLPEQALKTTSFSKIIQYLDSINTFTTRFIISWRQSSLHHGCGRGFAR